MAYTQVRYYYVAKAIYSYCELTCFCEVGPILSNVIQLSRYPIPAAFEDLRTFIGIRISC